MAQDPIPCEVGSAEPPSLYFCDFMQVFVAQDILLPCSILSLCLLSSFFIPGHHPLSFYPQSTTYINKAVMCKKTFPEDLVVKERITN